MGSRGVNWMGKLITFKKGFMVSFIEIYKIFGNGEEEGPQIF